MSAQRRMIVLSVVVAVIAAAIGSPYAYREWCSYRRNELTEQCRAARSRQRWDELQILADRWTAWDSQNGEAWMFRAQAAAGRREWSAAASHFWRVPDTDARVIPAMIELSKLAFTHLNDPLGGVEACERILRIDPRAAGAHQQLIWFYAMTLQREQLFRQIHAAIDVQREPREAYVYYFLADTLRSGSAVELNERWLEADPDSELFLVARVLQLPDSETESPDTPHATPAGETSKSMPGRSKLKRVEELLHRFPHNIELLAYKAEGCIANGDIDGVVALLSQAPDAARQDSRFWRIRGWLHESNSELEEANTAYRRALELHAIDWNTMNRLAVVERRRQNIAEVQRLTKLVERANEMRRVLRKIPAVELTPPAIFVELAAIYRASGDRKVGSALDRRLAEGR